MSDHYSAGYHSKRHADLLENEEYFYARAETARRYFKPEELESRIFDYGCGIGQSIALLPNAEGWDVSPEALAACRKRDLKVYDDLAEVPRGAYDMVLCRHVLEHVEHPLTTLETIKPLLRRGGTLLLILPKEPTGEAPLDLDLNQHLYCWTFRTINNLLHRAGFTPISNEMRYPLGWLAFLPVRRVLGSRFYVRLTEVTGRLARRNGELVIRAVPQLPPP